MVISNHNDGNNQEGRKGEIRNPVIFKTPRKGNKTFGAARLLTSHLHPKPQMCPVELTESCVFSVISPSQSDEWTEAGELFSSSGCGASHVGSGEGWVKWEE